MTTFDDMLTGANGLQARLTIANNSGLIPPARQTACLQDSIKWAGGLFYWPALQRLRTATAAKNTQNFNYDYYDYPPDFLDNSISRLYIDGVKYLPKEFEDLLDYADASLDPTLAPNPQNHFFANYGRQIFVYPSYTGVAPANNMLVWGQIAHPLVTTGGTTIFSNWDENGNEAIVKKAMAQCLERIDPPLSNALEQEGIGLLQVIWKKVTDGLQKSQRVNHQFFIAPDYFGFGGGLSTIGNFNIPVDIENEF